jgi:porphobilinogen deaminase
VKTVIKRPLPTRGLSHVALHVQKLEACERFYVDLLGMQGEFDAIILAAAIEDKLFLRALVGRIDGSEIVHGQISGPQANAEELGTALAEDLLSRGAKTILEGLTQDAK